MHSGAFIRMTAAVYRTGTQPVATSLAYVRVYGKATHNYYTLYFQYWDRAKTPELAREFKMKRPELFAAGCRGYRSYTDEPVRSQYPDDPDLPPQPCFTHPDTAGHFAGVAAIYFNGRNVSGGWWNSRGRISPDKCLTPRISGKPFFYPIELADSNLFCKCQDCVRLFPHLKGDLKTSHQKFFFISKIAVAAAKIKADIGISTPTGRAHIRSGLNRARQAGQDLCGAMSILMWRGSGASP